MYGDGFVAAISANQIKVAMQKGFLEISFVRSFLPSFALKHRSQLSCYIKMIQNYE